MEDTARTRQLEVCDQLILLLIAEPREGYELQFKEIMRREIERLSIPASGGAGELEEKSGAIS
jgi:hypothetical protein